MDDEKGNEELRRWQEIVNHQFDALNKHVDDLMWFTAMQDHAKVDKIAFCGPPPQNTLAQGPQNAGNPVKISAYTFTPKNIDCGKKHPLIVYVHGGVHSNFNSGGAHIIQELVSQGYLVISPDYRGSTGYGEMHWKLIDYGGLEVEDAFEARNWMVENECLVDTDRIGIMGWSHGGLITLMNLFNHPGSYKVGYAGVPVSDLIARMGYKHPFYHDLFAADYHIGRYAHQDPKEYRKRSPAWNAAKLQTPLLIHTNTSDEDVNCLEVERLIEALLANGKKDLIEYKIYQNAAGGHSFNRIDTQLAKESRREIYKFLARYLNPPCPIA